MDGIRDVLGMWVGENDSDRFWLGIQNGLKNRGVDDILIACEDGLTGFTNVIEAVYPKTEIQQCIIHQIRNTTRFVSYKGFKVLMSDLNKVYAAVDELAALSGLDMFEEKWPHIFLIDNPIAYFIIHKLRYVPCLVLNFCHWQVR